MKNQNINTDYLYIINKIDRVRQKLALHFSLYAFTRFFQIILLLFIFIIGLEGIFYFECSIRQILNIGIITSFVLGLIGPIIIYILVRKSFLKNFNDYSLAKSIGEKYPEISDTLLNSLQLNNQLTKKEKGYSTGLVIESLRKMSVRLKQVTFDSFIPHDIFKKTYLISFIIIFVIGILGLTSGEFYFSAFDRLLHSNTKYPIPLPFQIISENGNMEILGGDTTKVEFYCSGEFPEKLNLNIIFDDYTSEKEIILDSMGYGYSEIYSVRHDFIYEAFAENNSIFTPWERISSGFDTVFVTNRPRINKTQISVKYPEYTDIEEKIKKTNNPDIYAMSGSEITLNITTSKQISNAYLDFDNSNDKMLKVDGYSSNIKFTVLTEDQFKIIIFDEDSISNIDPVSYKINLNPDSYPMIKLLTPTQDFELSETMDIPLGIRISDDFGFSRAKIHYSLLKKYGRKLNNQAKQIFPLDNPDITFQEQFYNWNVSDLGLAPEDGIEFYIEIYDNDIINGPKKAATISISGFFPSLNDMFNNLSEKQTDIEDEGLEILSELKSTKEVLEEISRKLLKDPKIKWEQKEQLQKEIFNTRETEKKINKMAEKIDDILDKGKENQLFSDETLEKYTKLQEAFKNIMSPELKAAMEKLQKALEKMNPKETKFALDKFQTTHDEFSKELDRMLELFKRVQIEQSVDELVKRIDDLTSRQDSLTKEVDQNTNPKKSDWEEYSKEEKNIFRDSEILKDRMETISEDMKEFPLMPDKKLEQIIEEMIQSGLKEDLESAKEAMDQNSSESSKKSSKSASEKMQDIQQMLQQFQQEFNQQNMDEVISDFTKIIGNTLELSQIQEQMNIDIKKTSRRSEKLMELAVDQQNIEQNLVNIIKDITELSNKTFGISSDVGKDLGKASSQMRGAIKNMEDRNPHFAAQKGGKACNALNSVSLKLLASMDALQQSGSSSGFENYAKQLEKMAGQQKGLNSETEKLGMGQPKPMNGGRQQSLQNMAARQQQLRQSLQELQQELQQSASKQTGNLSGIAKDMEDVIKDLYNNKILRKTIERQNRILTRLLDAQKSMRTQSFKKERESKSGRFIELVPPGELPKNLGKRRSLLQENLEKALQNGYSSEYEEIIRLYFEELSKKENSEKK